MTVLDCHHCGAALDPERDDYYRLVQGWERPGRGPNDRSGSSLVLRHVVPDTVACVTCITRMRNSLDVRQESLL